MKILIDNNLSPHLARALAALSKPHHIQVEHIRDRFEPETPDTEWISALSADGGWTIMID